MSISERGGQHVLPTYPPRALALVRGEGCRVWDEEGREYLDLVAGLAVVSLGHGHPAPAAALAAQAAQIGHVSNLYWTEPAVALAERLALLTGLDGAFFCNSGAESVEAAVKLARRHGRGVGGPDKHEIVCLEGAFHGRTFAALQATWAESKKTPFQPLPGGFRHIARNDIAALEAAVGPQTAAVLLEPIQGEGGVHPVDDAFLERARTLCDTHDALLIFDEVQTGIGRCGSWFAFERTPVRPDAICLAKGLASGLPIGALVARRDDHGFQPGDHATTFGGSAPIAAAALATLDAIEREGLVDNARRVGDHLRAALGAIPTIREVRGAGLLIAIELADGDAARVADRLREEHGVLVNAVSPSALRLCPPLCLRVDEAERAVGAIRSVLDDSA
jgi:acetylornithine/N-succinyldiaminopimelate aminotransferase